MTVPWEILSLHQNSFRLSAWHIVGAQKIFPGMSRPDSLGDEVNIKRLRVKSTSLRGRPKRGLSTSKRMIYSSL